MENSWTTIPSNPRRFGASQHRHSLPKTMKARILKRTSLLFLEEISTLSPRLLALLNHGTWLQMMPKNDPTQIAIWFLNKPQHSLLTTIPLIRITLYLHPSMSMAIKHARMLGHHLPLSLVHTRMVWSILVK